MNYDDGRPGLFLLVLAAIFFVGGIAIYTNSRGDERERTIKDDDTCVIVTERSTGWDYEQIDVRPCRA